MGAFCFMGDRYVAALQASSSLSNPVGWFNLLGQVAVTTGITFGCAGLISTLATVNGYEPSAGKTLGIYAALLFSHGIVNSFGVHILRYLNNTSIVLHSLGVFSYAVAVVAKAPHHQSAHDVFAKFYDGTGDPGWSVRASPAYVACIGILVSISTLKLPVPGLYGHYLLTFSR